MTTPSRADLVAYLAGFLADLATETGIAMVDTAPGIAAQLDQAQAAAGDNPHDTAHYAAAEFFVLRRMRAATAARTDFDATAIKGGRSQVYNHISELMAEASAMAATYGVNLTAATIGDGSGSFVWSTDTIEPEIA